MGQFSFVGVVITSLVSSVAWAAFPPQPLEKVDLFSEKLQSDTVYLKKPLLQNSTPITPKQLPYWFLGSPTKDEVEGIRATQAVNDGLFKDREPKPIIVAILDSGIDINHPDIKPHIWKNEGEDCELDGTGMDGVDNDGNGYIDDCRGWNFAGTVLKGDDSIDTAKLTEQNSITQQKVKISNGKSTEEVTFVNVEYQNLTVASELGRLERKESLTPEEEKEKARLQKLYERDEKDFEGYLAMKNKLADFSADHHKIHALADRIIENFEQFIKENDGAKPFLSTLMKYMEGELEDAETDGGALRHIKGQLRGLKAREVPFDVQVLVASIKGFAASNASRFAYARVYLNKDFVGRELVMTEGRQHGNPDVVTLEPTHGTYVAHVVIKILTEAGVTDFKLMPVRTVPYGDEHDDDVIAAIRYAAANGAVVANGSWGKDVSPRWRDVIESYKKSVRIAEQRKTDGGKTFIMSHASGNDGRNNDGDVHYPSRFIPKLDDAGKFVEWEFDPDTLKGWIETGASTAVRGTALLADFTNYGQKSVHLFAPGEGIVSAKPWAGETTWRGTSAAAPMTAGVAGVIASYFPNLSQSQLEGAILSVRTDGLKDLEVKLPVYGGIEGTSTLDKLSIQGGLLDLINAVNAAEELSK